MPSAVVRASEVSCSPSSDCPPSGRAVGVRSPRAVGAGVRVWGPSTVPLACMPSGGCVPRGWWGAVPGGVACHRWEGRLVSGAVPPPANPPRRRAAGVPRPVCPGCGWRGRGDPAPAPQPHSPTALRASLARRGGGRTGVPGGGAFRRREGRLRSGAPPPPTARPPGGCRGLLATCCRRRCAGVGAQHCPLGVHALWGLRAAGVSGGCSWGGGPPPL